MTVGLDAVVVGKALAPLLVQLGKGATGKVKDALKRWDAATFSRRLGKKLATADKVKTIWAPDKETSLLSIYYPSKISIENEIRNVGSIPELPIGSLVIEGIVGHGKSMFLRYLYLQELAGKGGGNLPIFIELRTVTEKRDLDLHIREAFQRMEIDVNDDVFEYLLRSGKVVLLLDGFDELDESLTAATIHYIECLIDAYDDLRVVITSRPSGEIQKSRLFNTVQLLGLEKTDYNPFLAKLGVSSIKALEIVEAINKSPSDVSSLITTPLMMTLLVMVYESEHEIPSELPEFFERLFVTMFSRHDRQKAGFSRKHYSGLSERKLQLLFEMFCFITIKSKYGRSLSNEQLATAFDKACQHSGNSSCNVENFRKDIVKVACLMIEEGYDLTTFLHKSIAEYFAAAFVWRAADEFAEKFYASAIANYDTWGAVLTFLEKIDSYRFAKYYGIETRKKLIAELGLRENGLKPIDDWIKYFSDTQHDFGVMYATRSSHGGGAKPSVLSEELEPVEFGSYSTQAPFGGQLSRRITRAFMDGMREDLPTSLRQAELVQMPDVFVRHERTETSVGFRILFGKIVSEYGVAGMSKKLMQLELDIWRELHDMEKLVRAEEGKESILNDDLLFDIQ